MSRVLIMELGFPVPELQQEFRDRRGLIGFADFWWPRANLIGEFDGVAKYVRDEFTRGQSVADMVIREKNRENRLRALGHGVVRWDWETASNPARLREQLRAAGLPSIRR